MREIGLPVWLLEQHGNKYVGYCEHCERAYTEKEILWRDATPQAKPNGGVR
jgi:hypothetical protein